jgi:hypothetical protein
VQFCAHSREKRERENTIKETRNRERRLERERERNVFSGGTPTPTLVRHQDNRTREVPGEIPFEHRKHRLEVRWEKGEHVREKRT